MEHSLTEIIPHTGFGAALFSFLNEKELECLKLTSKTLKSDVEEQQKGKNYKPTPPPLGLIRKEGKLFLYIDKSQKKDKMQDVEKFDFHIVTNPFDLPFGVYSEFRTPNVSFLYEIDDDYSLYIPLTKEEHEIYTKAFETLEPKIKAEKKILKKRKALQRELRDQTCAVREVAHFNLQQNQGQFILGLLTQDQNQETETLDERITGWDIHSHDFEMYRPQSHWGTFMVYDRKTRKVLFEKAFRSKVELNVWNSKIQTLLPIIAEERKRFYSYNKTVRLNPNFKGTWKPTQPWKKV